MNSKLKCNYIRRISIFLIEFSVNTGMSRPPKPISQAKRVAPPAVPDIYRHSGSSFGSAGYGSSEDAGGFLAVPDATSIIGIRGSFSQLQQLSQNCF